jgi:hypothetical protein
MRGSILERKRDKGKVQNRDGHEGNQGFIACQMATRRWPTSVRAALGIRRGPREMVAYGVALEKGTSGDKRMEGEVEGDRHKMGSDGFAVPQDREMKGCAMQGGVILRTQKVPVKTEARF